MKRRVLEDEECASSKSFARSIRLYPYSILWIFLGTICVSTADISCLYAQERVAVAQTEAPKPRDAAAPAVAKESPSNSQSSLQHDSLTTEQQLAQQARREFEQGKYSLLRGGWSQAQDHFLAALKYKKTPGLLYHLAYTEEQLKHFADAYEHYQLASQLMKQVRAEDVAALLPAALGRVEAQIAILRISGLADSSRLVIDGRVKSALRFVAVDPGSHQLEVLSQGYENYVVEFEVKAGERLALVLTLKSLADEPLTEDAQEKTQIDAPLNLPSRGQNSLSKLLIYAGGGTSLVGLAVTSTGVILKQTAQNRQKKLYSQLEPAGSSSCLGIENIVCTELEEAYQQRKKGRVITFIGVAILALGVATMISGLAIKVEPSSYSLLPRFDDRSVGFEFGGKF